jgi:type II secretory pathway pseudopilin PulG
MTPTRHAEEGFTLVELILSLALMATVFVAVFAGLASFFSITASQRSNANLDAVVRQYVEQMTSPGNYVDCATAASYSSVTLPPASGSSSYAFSTPTTIGYWNGDNPATFSSTCATDKGVQQVNASITHTLGSKSQTVNVRFTMRKAS